jgi:hypothetical protein
MYDENDHEYSGYGLVIDWGEWFEGDYGYLFDEEPIRNAPGDLTVSEDSHFNGNYDVGLVYDGFYCNEWYAGECDGYWDYSYNTTLDISDSEFSSNGERGLDIGGAGDVILDGLTLDNNGWDNISVWEVDGYLSISDTTTTNSYCDGIYLHDIYDISLSDITSTGNGWGDYCTGLLVEDSDYVSIEDSTFNNNMAVGIDLEYIDGDISFDNVKANQNGYYGEDETDDYAFGIYLQEVYGDFTASKVTASGNLGDGLYMEYLYGDATISDSTFNNNDYYGIYYSSESYQSGGVGEGGLTTKSLGGNVYLTNVTVEGNGSDGADLYVNGNLEITCSSFKNNGDYAISAGVYGNATFSGVSTTGEVRVKVGGEFIELAGCVKVGGAAEGSGSGMGYKQGVGDDSQVSFNCDSYLGLQLTLPLGDFVKIPCGSNGSTGDYSASALSLAEGSLPAAPAGTFISAFEFTISDAQYAGSILVSFKLEAGESTEGYQIMFWDGTTWVSVGGAQVGDYFQEWVSQPGIYALVKN